MKLRTLKKALEPLKATSIKVPSVSDDGESYLVRVISAAFQGRSALDRTRMCRQLLEDSPDAKHFDDFMIFFDAATPEEYAEHQSRRNYETK